MNQHENNNESEIPLADQNENRAHEEAMLEFPIVEFSTPRVNNQGTQALWSSGVIEYGTATMPPDRPLSVDEVITLAEAVDDPVRLMIGGSVVAEGALVQEEGRIGIRLTRILNREPCSEDQTKKAIENAA